MNYPLYIRTVWVLTKKDIMSEEAFNAFRSIGQKFGMASNEFGGRLDFDQRQLEGQTQGITK